MNNFTYYSPTRIIFGKDTEMNVGNLIKEYGYSNILLHYGGGTIKKTGLYARIVTALNNAEITFTELSGVEPNPKVGLVREGIQICREKSIDFILAVGGGSVIDSAKAIAVGAKTEHDIWDFYKRERPVTAALPVGCILTIAAAGSEMSTSSVVTNTEGNFKRSIGSELIIPVFSVLNPEITFTVSKFQTGCGIVDIMMHTFERYFTNTRNVSLTDNIAEGLIKAVIDAGRIAINNPTDYEARATLMWAGSLSHNNLTGTGRESDWATHDLEHEISGIYDFVAHGAGLSVLFPAWCKYVYKHDLHRFKRYAVEIWDVDPALEESEAAILGIEKTKEYFKEIGMPISFKDLGIGSENIEVMADKATAGDTERVGGFVPLNKKAAKAIYELAAKEQE